METFEYEDGENLGVGLTKIGGGHTVIVISTAFDTGDTGRERTLFACPTCGLVSGDTRRFGTESCDREDNPIPQTISEQLEDDGVEELL